MTEAELLDTIRHAARLSGWLTYHTHRSDRSEPGFPDLVMVRGGRLLLWELKTDEGRVTRAQEEWMQQLGEVDRLNVNVVRPADLTNALESLR